MLLPTGELRRLRLPPEPPERSPKRRSHGWLWLVAGTWLVFSWGLFDATRRLRPSSTETGATAPVEKEPLDLRGGTRWRPAPAPSGAPDPRPMAAAVRAPRSAAEQSQSLGAHRRELATTAEIAEQQPPTLRTAGGHYSASAEAGTAHWFAAGGKIQGASGCEAAVSFYQTKTRTLESAPELVRSLEQKARYRNCRIFQPTALALCATLLDADVVGVTVRSEPPDLYLAGCVAAAVSRMHFARNRGLRQTRTELFWN